MRNLTLQNNPPTPVAIKVNSLTKTFRLPHEKHTSVKSAFVAGFRRKTYERQQALKDISFEVNAGEFFGIVGRNGSGKSTLLKLLAGIYNPDQGTILVNGSLTPFIELGVGFNQELTGRENVFLNGALLGFSRTEMEKMYHDIVSFAELRKFMDQKLKNYSSGMQVRLAFSIAIRAEGDILLLDEVLAVGDALFQQKCFNYFKELKKAKRTVILVSHDPSMLQEYCDRGILIEESKIVSRGKISVVVKDYIDLLNQQEERNSSTTPPQDSKGKEIKKNRWGSGDILVSEALTLTSEDGIPQTVFTEEQVDIVIRVKYSVKTPQHKPIYGVTISDATGLAVFASNTLWSEVTTGDVKKGDTISVEWVIPNLFNNGDFFISPAVANNTGYISFDWREGFKIFKVRKATKSSALINIKHDINLKIV